MKINSQVALVLGLTAMAAASSAFAAKETSVKKAESAMMGACKKEYAKDVKGKTFQEVAEWVETEERGTNADSFKKSKCYALHEKWEGVAEKHEEGEEHEHN